MEVLGVGPMELFLIVALALILLGPKDMAKAGTTIGKWLNNFVRSDTWQVLRESSKTISNLPTRLMREANLEGMEKGLKDINPKLPSLDEMEAWAKAPEQFRQPPQSDPSVGAPEENSIQPPRSQPYAAGKPEPVKKVTRRRSTTKAPVKTEAADKSGKSSKASSAPGSKTNRGNKDNA